MLGYFTKRSFLHKGENSCPCINTTCHLLKEKKEEIDSLSLNLYTKENMKKCQQQYTVRYLQKGERKELVREWGTECASQRA